MSIKTKVYNDLRDDVFAQEYDLSFPEDEEFKAWVKSLEAQVKTHFYDSDVFDPFDTINS